MGVDVAAAGAWVLTALAPEARFALAPHRLTQAASDAAAALAQQPSGCVRAALRPETLAPTLDALLRDLGANDRQCELLKSEVAPVLTAAMDALGAPTGLLRLEVVRSQSCPKWHVDRLRLRLGCALHGAGTEYLSPGSDPERAAAADLKQVPAGTFFAMAGSSVGLGLWHRSPHACDQHPRLFLALDPS